MHNITTGGHFYSFSNMQDTLSGIIHNTVMGDAIAGPEHVETRILLFKMLEYLYKFYAQGADPQSEYGVGYSNDINLNPLYRTPRHSSA